MIEDIHTSFSNNKIYELKNNRINSKISKIILPSTVCHLNFETLCVVTSSPTPSCAPTSRSSGVIYFILVVIIVTIIYLPLYYVRHFITETVRVIAVVFTAHVRSRRTTPSPLEGRAGFTVFFYISAHARLVSNFR